AGTTTIGIVGLLAEAAVTASGLAAPVVAFEIDLDAAAHAPRLDRGYRAASAFPPSNIDLAFVVPDGVTASDVGSTIRSAVGPLLEAVRVFDEFRDERIGADRRSLAFALQLRAVDRTLTDAEVADVRGAAIAAVAETHGGVLRA